MDKWFVTPSNGMFVSANERLVNWTEIEESCLTTTAYHVDKDENMSIYGYCKERHRIARDNDGKIVYLDHGEYL